MPGKSIDEILRQMQINKETELQKKEEEEFLLFQKNEKLRQEYLRYIRTYEKIGVPSLAPSSSSSSAGGKIIISATASPTQSVPTIVTDNLQLYLDAGDTDSYPGSGTTWFDLSANAYTTATLVNGVGFTSSNGGALTFAVDDYVDVNQSLASGTFSVGCWFKTSSAGIKMLLSKETAAGNPWNYRIWMNDGQIYADMSQVTTQSNLTSPLTTYND
jgi:hypothetical protein